MIWNAIIFYPAEQRASTSRMRRLYLVSMPVVIFGSDNRESTIFTIVHFNLIPVMRNTFLFLFVWFFHQGVAQNLVPNASFEDVACGPEEMELIVPFDASYWYVPTLGTPDMFSDGPAPGNCAVMNINTLEFQYLDEWQYPQDGLRMAGMYVYAEFGCVREYLQVQLMDSLKPGDTYCVQFQVNLSNRSLRAIDRLGALFTDEPFLDQTDICLYSDEVQVENPPGVYLTDTLNWMTISGEFIADGGEQFLTIGNFVSLENSTAVIVEGTSEIPWAYYYVDNVVVENCTETNSTGDLLGSTWLSYWPNPAKDQLYMKVFSPVECRVVDIAGRTVMQFVLQTGQNEIDISSLNRGIYAILPLVQEPGNRGMKLVID